ncbi:ferredoxin--NADP reductase [Soonwooa sp.]|uniref:ferredoxin--NADP reductase n=1 Tax=Soonwooa sp. TaxID=1938592 RepID=UPI00261FA58D|nr:ferredoxin--NADP reductase [Soonwooa sp.]
MTEQIFAVGNQPQFYRLKLVKKIDLTKDSFLLGFEIPQELKSVFAYKSGQYVGLKFNINELEKINDYSITTAPEEENFEVAIKISSPESSANAIYQNYNVGDEMSVSTPQGRFSLILKPDEKRSILAFAAGIGITPIFSQIKNLLHHEPSTRIFLFYSNKTQQDVIFKSELDKLEQDYSDRFFVHYFFSRERINNLLFEGRFDDKKVGLIINQILHLDVEDEESTIWDATDKVVICGPGEMIKSVANACYNRGIPKRDIHFELFQSFNEDIYPQEKAFPLVENIKVKIKYNHLIEEDIILKNNKGKILQQLLGLGINVPYSCKSGVCGSCLCKLKNGEVEMEENEYLTDRELAESKILPCSAIAMSQDLFLDFDIID